MLFLVSTLVLAAPADSGRWIAFDRRQSGVAEAAAEYDSATLRRRGALVQVSFRHAFLLSGLSDIDYLYRVEFDCARSLVRTLVDRSSQHGAFRNNLHTPRAPFRPILTGSVEAALAARLCAPAVVRTIPEAGEE